MKKPIKKTIRIMKRTIVTLVLMLIAPLAFAETSSTHNRQATTTESITVTGTIIPTPEEGAAAGYSLSKRSLSARTIEYPRRYVLNGPGHVVDKSGRVVQTAIKPGTRVLVYYISTGDLRMVDHVVVLD